MDFHRIKKLPAWIEDTPATTSWLQRIRARFGFEPALFWAFVEEYKNQMIVYLSYSTKKNRYFVDIPHGYFPYERFDEPDWDGK